MNYTVNEVAKKLRVSEGQIYKLVKKGDLKKIDGLGKTIRISSKDLKDIHALGYSFSYDSEKVQIFDTTLGKVRMTKDNNKYVLVDIKNALGINDSYSIVKTINNKHIVKLSAQEAENYGFFSNHFGLLLISAEGINEYRSKSRNKIKVDKLIKELGISLKEEKSTKPKTGLIADKLVAEPFNSSVSAEAVAEGQEVLSFISSMVDKSTNKETGLMTFKNELFQVSLKLENGQTVYDAETVAKSLGLTTVAKSGNDCVRWSRVNEYLKVSPQVGKGDFIPEPVVYKLAFKANNEIAEKFQDWLATEVLPSINHTGGYVANGEKFVNNYFATFSPELRKEMIAEIKIKIKQLYIERERIDTALLDKVHVVEEIEKSLEK